MGIEPQNKIMRRRQVLVVAVAGLCGIILTFVVPERWMVRLSVLGILVIFLCLILVGIVIGFSRERKNKRQQ
jgi:cell division protein FtsW (lipid II flippase)